MATIGLKDIYYAVITSDDESGTVYETPKKFAPAMNLTYTPTYNRANLRGDDRVIATAASKGATTVSVGLTELTKEAQVDVLGATVASDGGILEGANDRPKDVALMYRAEKANGSYRYDVIYKVQFSPSEEALATKEETPTFSTPTLTGEAIPRLSDGWEKKKFDQDDEEIDPTVFTNFFAAVPEPEPTPEV
ncbi:major tail protein [Oceanobacillus profundus]|uniref:major tail protein n=1 Tax=Oceanobacillus profundus TaxID=372463 RepID=UPI0026E2F6F5|nr:major tail protein [Oceanobacillus profundus]MDO6451718.1 phage tail protein [Oceanobacillus profundus]